MYVFLSYEWTKFLSGELGRSRQFNLSDQVTGIVKNKVTKEVVKLNKLTNQVTNKITNMVTNKVAEKLANKVTK